MKKKNKHALQVEHCEAPANCSAVLPEEEKQATHRWLEEEYLCLKILLCHGREMVLKFAVGSFDN